MRINVAPTHLNQRHQPNQPNLKRQAELEAKTSEVSEASRVVGRARKGEASAKATLTRARADHDAATNAVSDHERAMASKNVHALATQRRNRIDAAAKAVETAEGRLEQATLALREAEEAAEESTRVKEDAEAELESATQRERTAAERLSAATNQKVFDPIAKVREAAKVQGFSMLRVKTAAELIELADRNAGKFRTKPYGPLSRAVTVKDAKWQNAFELTWTINGLMGFLVDKGPDVQTLEGLARLVGMIKRAIATVHNYCDFVSFCLRRCAGMSSHCSTRPRLSMHDIRCPDREQGQTIYGSLTFWKSTTIGPSMQLWTT